MMIAKGTSTELAESLRRLAELIEDCQLPIPVAVSYYFDDGITVAMNCESETAKFLAYETLQELVGTSLTETISGD